MRRSSITKNFSLLTALTLFEKFIAFLFQAILASMFGAGFATDAYFSSSEFFGVLEVSVISTLTVAALNRYTYHLNREGEEKAFDFLSRLLSFYIPAVTVISACILVFAKPISYLVAPGFDENARTTLILCIWVMAVIPIIECFTALGLAVLRQKRRFGITGLKSLFISLVGIVFVFVFFKAEVNIAVVLSAAYVVSMLMFCILTMIYVRKYGKFRLFRPKITPEIKSTLHMIFPLIVSYGITRTTLMIGRIIASFLGEGAVSQLTYAHSLYAVVSAVFITNLTTILLTDFNELIAQKCFTAVGNKIRSVTSIMTILLIPITVVSVFCSTDVVKIVYERGNFTAESTALVAPLLAAYAIGFIPAMIHGIYNQVLYANSDTKAPMWIAFVCIVVNLGLSLLFIRSLGLLSVAIGSVVSSIIAVVMCKIKVKKFLPDYHGCYSVKFLLCCAGAGGLCIAAAAGVQMLHLPAVLSFMLATVVCFGVFLLTLLLMKEQNLTEAYSILRKKLRRR